MPVCLEVAVSIVALQTNVQWNQIWSTTGHGYLPVSWSKLSDVLTNLHVSQSLFLITVSGVSESRCDKENET